jgi:eukaryotic-like serine/threonine-protein kinase
VPGNSAEDRGLLNLRIAYFGKVMFSLSLAFYLFNGALRGLFEGSLELVGNPGEALHAAATALFGLAWLGCRGNRRSARELAVIDVGTLIGSIACFAWKGVIETGGFEQATVTVMTSLATIVTHAVIVPATSRRTFWLACLASLPATVAAYAICRRIAGQSPQGSAWMALVGTAYIAMWSALTVAIATLTSRVIYGLRRRAQNALEIGQYTLEAPIGAGAMGVVYRARHSLLRRPTAIKLLPPELSGEVSIRRFEREVQLTSGLTHPNTIAIYDFGRTPDGVFYYVMEYLDGITLEDLVRHGGPLPAARVVHLLEQLCGALVEAHGVGLVHRDIKPANLMLCVRGRVSDHLKVLDFGLVKEVAGLPDPQGSLVASLVGTPLYMAPEAILEPATVAASADIYAVGAVAYFLLVGEPVFVGATVMEVCVRHLHEPPAPIATRANAAVPPALDELVLACLQKDPQARPRSAAALRNQLAEIEGLSRWKPADADGWWEGVGRSVVESARAEHPRSERISGPKTLAIDWAARRRAPAAA